MQNLVVRDKEVAKKTVDFQFAIVQKNPEDNGHSNSNSQLNLNGVNSSTMDIHKNEKRVYRLVLTGGK